MVKTCFPPFWVQHLPTKIGYYHLYSYLPMWPNTHSQIPIFLSSAPTHCHCRKHHGTGHVLFFEWSNVLKVKYWSSKFSINTVRDWRYDHMFLGNQSSRTWKIKNKDEATGRLICSWWDVKLHDLHSTRLVEREFWMLGWIRSPPPHWSKHQMK